MGAWIKNRRRPKPIVPRTQSHGDATIVGDRFGAKIRGEEDARRKRNRLLWSTCEGHADQLQTGGFAPQDNQLAALWINREHRARRYLPRLASAARICPDDSRSGLEHLAAIRRPRD